MSKRLMVYRFGRDTVEIARYRELLSGYSLAAVVSPGGWGYAGREAAEMDGGPLIGMQVEKDFLAALEHCDTIYVSDEGREFTDKNIQEVKTALCSHKEVLIPVSLATVFHENHFDPSEYRIMDAGGLCEPEHDVKNIEIPIIVVYGMSSYMQKFDIQLMLGDYFRRAGYRVAQLGSKAYSSLFGFAALPHFLFDTGVSETDKILAFNHYANEVVKKASADVLIIGIPGAVMPLSMQDLENSGVLPYLICNSVIPDIAVMSIGHNVCADAFIQELQKLSRYRYNCPAEYFHLSHIMATYDRNMEIPGISYSYAELSELTQHLMRTTEGYKVFNVFDRDSLELCQKEILDQLSGNVGVL